MTFLYITADSVGAPSGGGRVTKEESDALRGLGPCEVWDRKYIGRVESDPWGWDDAASDDLNMGVIPVPKLAHFYAGAFTKTVETLKRNGTKIAYTAAAHDIAKSRAEHEKFGFDFAAAFPHLCDPELWKRYVGGYLAADLVICPSRHSADAMRGYGCKNVAIISHGVDLPESVAPPPKQFTVGYLGSYGPDKGVVYLLQAWKRLNYGNATLVLAGRDSLSPFVRQLVMQHGGGNVILRGWIDNVADFYSSISLYVQPSVTEGFGIEVLESLSFGRPVICSDGAGAADVVSSECGFVFASRDVDALADRINWYKLNEDVMQQHGKNSVSEAAKYTWEIIRGRYMDVWRGLS